MKNLRSALAHTDGSRTDLLERIAAECAATPGAIDKLLAIAEADSGEAFEPCDSRKSGRSRASGGRVAVGATWVILAIVREKPGLLSDACIDRLVKILGRAVHWGTRLHVLQAFAVADTRALSKPRARAIAMGALDCIDDPKPFVRAWALNVVGILGERLPPKARSRAAATILGAERTDAASVRARIRNLRKAGSLDWLDALRARSG